MNKFLYCSFTLLVLLVFSSVVRGQELLHVLLLNSYHHGLDWTDGETAGIQEVLDASNKNVELHAEYLDTKRLTDQSHFDNVLTLLKTKYKHIDFSAIITTDNDALDFVRQNRRLPIFAEVPVVFAGVNFFTPEILTGIRDITGVAETFEVGQTINLMQKLHPKTKHIVVILDATITGKAIREELDPMLKPFIGQIDFEFWSDLSIEQIQQRLPALKSDSLVLLMPFARDRNGVFVRYADMAAMVSKYSPVAVYGTYDFYLGHGIIGGRITNAIDQGRAAANLLIRVLHGTHPNQIPVMTISPSKFQFDGRELHRFNISEQNLPAESKILYQTWYESHRTWIWLWLLLSLVTLISSLGWWKTHQLKRRTELRLRENEKQLLAELKQGNERFAAILDATTESIFLVDPIGTILAINKTAAHRFNKSPQEMIGVCALDFFPPEVKESRRKTLNEVLLSKKPIYTEDSRNSHFFALNYYPILDDQGSVTSVVVYATEITERKLSEVAVHESHQRITELLNSMAEGAYGVDKKGNITFVNSSFLKILGYPDANELIGKHAHELMHHSYPDGSDYPSTECKIYQAYRLNQEMHAIDEVFWKKDGTSIPVEYWSRPIDRAGVILGAIVTFIDISQRKEAEDKLRYSEQRFRDVSEAAGEYLWEIDTNMRYTYVSARSFEVKGYTPEELLGHTPMEFMHEDDWQLVNEIVSRAITNQPFKLEHRDITKTGAVVWEAVSGVPFLNKNGDVIGLRGTGLSITERKEREDKVHRMAFFDPLTKLPNRRLLNERLSYVLTAAKRSERYGALLFLDLDNFKPLNDQQGHIVGDLLLIEVADRLQTCVREMDTVARFGGDEFVVMLSDLDADKSVSIVQAKMIAEKIRGCLAAPYQLTLTFEEKEDLSIEHHCSASIGVTMFNHTDTSQSAILERADAAMYKAKEAGRNSIRFYVAE